jgi:hypothetical protein
MSGWPIAAELARGEKTAHIAIVLLSAVITETETLRELEQAAIPYIDWPLLDATGAVGAGRRVRSAAPRR